MFVSWIVTEQLLTFEVKLLKSFNINSPFYSCVLSNLALDCKRGWG